MTLLTRDETPVGYEGEEADELGMTEGAPPSELDALREDVAKLNAAVLGLMSSCATVEFNLIFFQMVFDAAIHRNRMIPPSPAEQHGLMLAAREEMVKRHPGATLKVQMKEPPPGLLTPNP